MKDASTGGRELPRVAAEVNGARCLVYDGTQDPRPLPKLADISDVLAESEAFVWLDVINPQPHDFALFQEEFGLHPLAIEDALKAHERPKIEAYDDSWFVVVQGATREGDALRIHEVSIFVGAKFIVTARSRPPYPLDEVERRWQELPAGVRRDSGALLYTILDTVVDGTRRSPNTSNGSSRPCSAIRGARARCCSRSMT